MLAIAFELIHQLGASVDNARPAGDFVENLIDNVVGDDIEEVITVDQVAQRPTNELEVGFGARERRIFLIPHQDLLA
jgi:hypothetical protein